MAVLNPEHLLEQADRLVAPPPAGPPRQVDVRRAISAAYYAVFHHVLTAAADEYVGKTKRSTRRYALLYRSIDHGSLKQLCTEAKKPTMPQRYQRYMPAPNFGARLQAFATALVDLQEKRHAADYDPVGRVITLDAKVAVATARTRRAPGRAWLPRASAARRKMFLAFLLFPPR